MNTLEAGSRIFEHRDGEREIVSGTVDYVDRSKTRNTLTIGWHQDNGGNRTTVFSLSAWTYQAGPEKTTLARIKENPPSLCDYPPQNANLYTITP